MDEWAGCRLDVSRGETQNDGVRVENLTPLLKALGCHPELFSSPKPAISIRPSRCIHGCGPPLQIAEPIFCRLIGQTAALFLLTQDLRCPVTRRVQAPPWIGSAVGQPTGQRPWTEQNIRDGALPQKAELPFFLE